VPAFHPATELRKAQGISDRKGNFMGKLTVDISDIIVRSGSAEIAYQGEARQQAVERVLAAPVGTGDGRSEFFWLRLANGDLYLAVAPQGETYESLEGEPGTGWA
jgi:hypothetical protein